MFSGLEGQDSAVSCRWTQWLVRKQVPMWLARMVVVLCMGPRRDERTGQGRAMAEVGFHSDLLCLHECGRDFLA